MARDTAGILQARLQSQQFERTFEFCFKRFRFKSEQALEKDKGRPPLSFALPTEGEQAMGVLAVGACRAVKNINGPISSLESLCKPGATCKLESTAGPERKVPHVSGLAD